MCVNSSTARPVSLYYALCDRVGIPKTDMIMTMMSLAFPLQIFPIKADPRWHGPPPGQLSLALQQALAKELLRAKQGHVQQGGLSARLLQAMAALLTSAHAGPVVLAMHRSHALSCPLMRQLHLYQVHGWGCHCHDCLIVWLNIIRTL